MRYGPGPMTGERAPSRHVALDGAVNVRDIGGYRIVGGPEVVRGRLFRGDSLSQLTRSDLERLDRLGLRTVVDFRTPGEVLLGRDDQLALTKREVEVLKWTADGKTSGEISDLLSVSENTVNFHVRNAVSKLQSANRTAAVVRAAMLGLLN